MSVLGKWTAKGLPRPAWSNAGGTVRCLHLIIEIAVSNRPLPSCCKPHYENEAKCKTFYMKISFDCI